MSLPEAHVGQRAEKTTNDGTSIGRKCDLSGEGTFDDIFASPIHRRCVGSPGTGVGILLDPFQLVSLVDVPPEHLHSPKQLLALTWHTHSRGMEAGEEIPEFSFRLGRFQWHFPWKCGYLALQEAAGKEISRNILTQT